MTTPDLLPLDQVYFVGPVPVHGRLVREIKSHAPMPALEGGVIDGWELHLHAEWQCVVVEGGEDVGQSWVLVPLQHVRTMVMSGEKLTPEPSRRGRPRTKRLDFVRE